jgi:chorismate mutase
MSAAIDAVRELLTLTESVRGLRTDVMEMLGELKDLRERVVRLEAREEVIIERTRNAAVMAVHQMNGTLLERLIAVELAQDSKASAVKARRGTPKLKSAG